MMGRQVDRAPWLWHVPDLPWAQPVADDVLRVLLCAAPGMVAKARVRFGDRYGSLQLEAVMTPAGRDGTGEWWCADLRLPTRRFQYQFEVRLANGEVWLLGECGAARTAKVAGVFQVPYLHPGERLVVPDWTARAVAYQIFPDRFAKGSDPGWPHDRIDEPPRPDSVFGGNLRGIREHLDDLANLGVTLIYCTPIFAAPSNHKYDTEDYLRIDPQFGTEDDLCDLVAEAHERGMRVLLDAVFNHCGERFPPFQDVVQSGRQSPYWDWFFIDGDTVDLKRVNYETFATGLRSMPKLNTDHPELAAFLLDVAERWMRCCGIDGWRLDVANEVSPAFWRAFRTRVKRIRPDALIIGEVWHDGLPWLRGDQFDGVMNYVLRDIVLAGVIDGFDPLERTAERLTRLALRYPPAAAQASLNLLGSHDTERLWTRAGGRIDAIEAAMALQFMWPGIPMIYYGDEIGMEGGNDPDCRRPMRWGLARQHQGLRAFVRDLARLRLEAEALATTEVRVRADGDALVVERGEPGRALGLRLTVSGTAGTVPGTVCLCRVRPPGEWSIIVWKE